MARGATLPLAFKPRTGGVGAWPSTYDAMRRHLLVASDGTKYSETGLARAAGVAQATVTRFLRGRGKLSLRSGLLVARALGISPWRLVEYNERIQPLISPEMRAKWQASMPPRPFYKPGDRKGRGKRYKDGTPVVRPSQEG